ncbi:hypothetical protein C8R44DRAFT_881377 [Mycena epipterygia]|nr:hypothetical protein C8R44DRAFT_881377 [Mycena epipterygia]
MHSVNLAPVIGATVGLAMILYGLHSRVTTRSVLPLPPRLRKMPVVGDILDLPSAFEWETYKDWSRQYSQSVTLDLAGKSAIVLSSFEATEDLLENFKHSSIYSDRYTAVFQVA